MHGEKVDRLRECSDSEKKDMERIGKAIINSVMKEYPEVKSLDPLPIKIPVSLSLEDLISELLLKHQSFLNITVNRKGNATLQIFSSDMKRTYKGDTVEKLVELVGREEGL